MLTQSNRWLTYDNVFSNSFGINSRWANINGTGASSPFLLPIDLNNDHSSFYFNENFSFDRIFVLPIMIPGQHHYIHFHLNRRTSGTGGTVSIRFQQNALYVNDNQTITASQGTPFDLLLATSDALTHLTGSYYIHFPSSFDRTEFPSVSTYRGPYLIRISQANLNDSFNRIFLRGGSNTSPSITFSQPETGSNTGIYNRIEGELNITTNNNERLRIADSATTIYNNLNISGTLNEPAQYFLFTNTSNIYAPTTRQFKYYIFALDNALTSNCTFTIPTMELGDSIIVQVFCSSSVVSGVNLSILNNTGAEIWDAEERTNTANSGSRVIFRSLGITSVNNFMFVRTAGTSNAVFLLKLGDKIGVPNITPMIFSQGTAASPSLTFDNDLNTGIYRPETDQLGISTAGIERLKITNDDIEFSTKHMYVQSQTTSNITLTLQNTPPFLNCDTANQNIIVILPADFNITTGRDTTFYIAKNHPSNKVIIRCPTGTVNNHILNGVYNGIYELNDIGCIQVFSEFYNPSVNGFSNTCVWSVSKVRGFDRSNDRELFISNNVDINSFIRNIVPVNTVDIASLISWRSVAYSEPLDMFTIVGGGTNQYLYSRDGGNNFLSGIITASVSNFINIKWVYDRFIALYEGFQNSVRYSTDGINWFDSVGLIGQVYTDVIYLPSFNRFVICALQSNASRTFISTDGINWSSSGLTQSNSECRSLAFAPELGTLGTLVLMHSSSFVLNPEFSRSTNGGTS